MSFPRPLRRRSAAASTVAVLALVTMVLPARTVATAGPAKVRAFTLGATGDLLGEDSVLAAARRAATGSASRYDFVPLLAPVERLVSSVDLAICHLEGPLGRPDQRAGRYGREQSRGWRMLGAAELAPAIAATGFDRCSTASNHSNDLGLDGIEGSLAQLDAAGLGHSGTARTPGEARTKLLLVNGVKVAHLAYTNTSNTSLPREPWRVAWGDADRVVADVAAARRAGAEVVVVSVHQGDEGSNVPASRQLDWAEEVTRRARVDLVIMHGPHTVQPVEQVNGTWVFWSVGNFLTGMGGGGPGIYGKSNMLDGLFARARFEEDPRHPGRFRTSVRAIATCVDPVTRTIHPVVEGLADPTTSPRLRSLLVSCWKRIRAVEPSAS